jgi:hypothetical protein
MSPSRITVRDLRARRRELLALHERLTTAGTPCSLTTTPAVTLLIGTAGGGVITAGLTDRHPGWWVTGATGADLTARPGRSLTDTIDAEIGRRTHAADAEYRSEIHRNTVWPGQAVGEGSAACTG